MATGERQAQKHRRKMPSFSSSLLDAIYHSIDDPRGGSVGRKCGEDGGRVVHRRNDPEQEIESLRRAIRVEKWMENHTAAPMHHVPSNSAGSSTDSSMFSSSETESSAAPKPTTALPKREGRFTRTKSRALKIYGDLKRVKEPISPGGKIVNFLNSLFGPRSNLIKKSHPAAEEWGCSVRKSRSMKGTGTSTSTNTNTDTTRSCLNRNPNKSKRTVRFCPDSVILDEDIEPRGQKNVCRDDACSVSASVPNIGSRFIKWNMESLRGRELREFCEQGSDGVDDMSCASSDLFELENIGRVGIGVQAGAFEEEEELPVYGTTSLKVNQAIANGLIM